MKQNKGRRKCSIELPNAPLHQGETKPLLSPLCQDGHPINHTLGVNSLYDNFIRGRNLAGRNAPAFGYRPTIDGLGNVGPYRWITWDLFHERFVNLSSGLRRLGMGPTECLGIFMGNCVEWVLAEFACHYQKFISVPMYTSLATDALAHVVRQTEMAVAICTCELAQRLLEVSEQTRLEIVVVTDTPSEELLRQADAQSISIRTLQGVEAEGAQGLVEPEQLPMPQDTATIIYTSGTVGLPKGVVITHANFLATLTAISHMQHGYVFTPFSAKTDCSMGFLPLAHCLGRMVVHIMVASGVKTAFPRSDPGTLMEDLNALQPTIFVGVPRVFNRIQDKVLSAVRLKGGLPSALFQYAYSTKRGNLGKGQVSHWLWDRVIFKPLRDKFGGQLRLIVSGSAPISAEALEFLRCCFSCDVVEGYGLSETIGPSSITSVEETESGNVGVPIPCAQMKLRDVSDLDYRVTDQPYPRGEILIKGDHVARQYFKLPELTSEMFTEDGWLCTGDIGTIDSFGRFRVIDRKNNMFKLAQGLFIAPERIENIYADHFIVNQCFVYGDSLRHWLVAIIVPDHELLLMFVKNKGIQVDGSPKDICKDPGVVRAVLDELAGWGRAHGLCGYENPKNIMLSQESFEGLGLLTPTFKLKRREAIRHFKSTLEDLYTQVKIS